MTTSPPAPTQAAVVAAAADALAGFATLTITAAVPLDNSIARWSAHLADVNGAQFDGCDAADLPIDDPAHAMDELAGHGLTQDEALANLYELMRRLTCATVTRPWHPGCDEQVAIERQIGWDNQIGRLVVLAEDRYPITVVHVTGGRA
ncbi:hypothetical protein ETD86_30055 [Nonomuraea turkmeniaca]|uniref:Uncharacterized protein n=1 Tax=Nonomuraea turkmeniaca TaxID=103838 RepID=A0A5S4FUF3_9ACTN|nr:hypothetical protein [Nonomuraea turkmeniaca]TMR13810.1 hypothetical protein ETD86_30055 [Nonomuraea turkmeniaca]